MVSNINIPEKINLNKPINPFDIEVCIIIYTPIGAKIAPINGHPVTITAKHPAKIDKTNRSFMQNAIERITKVLQDADGNKEVDK